MIASSAEMTLQPPTLLLRPGHKRLQRK
jgi:hypothetical protein